MDKAKRTFFDTFDLLRLSLPESEVSLLPDGLNDCTSRQLEKKKKKNLVLPSPTLFINFIFQQSIHYFRI